MKERYHQLDALRGYAIFTMILSGSIAFGNILPAWMFHAQVPPPTHQFNPQIPGITWVDLVFPFFIFCMGAAVPIAFNKKKASISDLSVVSIAFRRYVLLIYFALLLEHFKANKIAENPTHSVLLFSMVGFFLLMLSFTKWSKIFSLKTEQFFNASGYLVGVVLLFIFPFNKGKGFDISNSDIIIVVLANMAFFGTIIWWYTQKSALIRLGILPFIMAVFLTSKQSGTWNEWIFNLTPESGIYRFYFLKYLFLFIPGTIAGEWLLKDGKNLHSERKHSKTVALFIFCCVILLIGNLFFLLSRSLNTNLIFSISMLTLIHFIFSRSFIKLEVFLKNCLQAASYCLLLGLFFEAFEGGIKKDPSTYSYYFVTAGFSFFSLIIFTLIAQYSWLKSILNFFTLVGQNPMMAYVLGALLLIPFMKLTGLYPYWNSMNTNWFLGFMKGFVFTIIACGITIPFTKKGLIWKT
ncbi:MAG: DUF5009 domain-containing protein [Chitinophaga sp.]|nr:DUF5009 domain-containing protein [Chitinophaga sp.]